VEMAQSNMARMLWQDATTCQRKLHHIAMATERCLRWR
jgi:hypothetical protein